jgi:predicted dithiol-disulfide oxidoreductase (DUF899 family)
MPEHRTGTREQWLSARTELLDLEKEHARRGDELARIRLALPWVRIEEEYRFETHDGTKTLAELFDGRSQLLVYHLMFGVGLRVDNDSEACTGCSFVADHFDAALPHLNGHGVTLIASSIAPLDNLLAYKRRMDWRFPWVSALGSDFHHDFGVAFTDDEQRQGAEYNYALVHDLPSQREGMSAFALNNGSVYHTYSTYGRGVEALMGTYPYLDRAPLGRNEADLEFPAAWWRRHDEYNVPS